MSSLDNTAPTISAFIPKASRASSNQARTRRNDRLMWVLMAIVCVAPLPLGSNRPIFWAILALAIGLVGTVYFLAAARAGDALRFPLSRLRLQVVLFILLCLFIVLQTLPVAAPFGLDTILSGGAATITSSTISVATGPTLLMLLRMVTYGVFFLLMLQVSMRESRRERMLDILLTAVVFYALVGLISLQSGDTILGLPKWAYFGSATGTFVNRNSFATFLAFGAAIAATRIVSTILLARQDGASFRASTLVLYLVVFGILLVTVVATQSRMGLFVTVAGAVTVFILSLAHGSRNRVLLTILLTAGVLGAAAYLVLGGSGMFERLGGLERSATIRFELYGQIWQMILARPWTGFGAGTFDLAFPLFHQLPVNPDVAWDKGHNTYLTLWSELGLVAGSLPVLLLAICAIPIASANAGGTGSWTSTTSAIAVMVVGGLHSLVDFSLEIQANTFFFLSVVAIGMAAAQHSKASAAR